METKTAEQILDGMRTNLEMIQSLLRRRPELFALAPTLINITAYPSVEFGRWSTTRAKRLEVARAASDADWRRVPEYPYISWIATIEGVRFTLTDMEGDPLPKEGVPLPLEWLGVPKGGVPAGDSPQASSNQQQSNEAKNLCPEP